MWCIKRLYIFPQNCHVFLKWHLKVLSFLLTRTREGIPGTEREKARRVTRLEQECHSLKRTAWGREGASGERLAASVNWVEIFMSHNTTPKPP